MTSSLHLGEFEIESLRVIGAFRSGEVSMIGIFFVVAM